MEDQKKYFKELLGEVSGRVKGKKNKKKEEGKADIGRQKIGKVIRKLKKSKAT